MSSKQEKRSGKRCRRSAAGWQALIQSHQRSGLSQASFCRREGISEVSLSSWRKKLAPAAKQASPESMVSFIELGAALPLNRAPSKALTVRLELGGGMVLTVSRTE
jgi:hypothetical protein